MLKNYDAALQYVHDYFYVDYRDFINKYFKDNKADLSRTITKKLYQKLFGSVSEKQLAIINDHTSQHIVVAAGPGRLGYWFINWPHYCSWKMSNGINSLC